MRKTPLLISLLAALLVALLVAPTDAVATTPQPRTPSGLIASIEPLARYVGQTSCDPSTKPGTAKLAALLTNTYRGTYAATVYACGTDGSRSEHYDGRAIDWMVSIRNATQYADAKMVIAWLLWTDRSGNKFARARRLGVQYIIYNNKIWGSYSQKWEPYENCASTPSPAQDSYCHRNHMHISLSWDGGMGLTTWWTNKIAPFDYGPCRPKDLNWAMPRPRAQLTSCPYYSKVAAPSGASTTKKNLVTYSGVYIYPGITGPAVSAVQAALHVAQTGQYDTATVAAVMHFKATHGQTRNNTVDQNTWRALLAAVK
jgi:hypothetical protein